MAASLTYTRRKRVVDLTPSEYQEVRRLNFRDGGNMQGRVSYIRQSKDATAEAIMIRRRSDKRLVGWALVHHWEKPDVKTVYFYVRRDERRKGYGSRLMKHARKIEPIPLVDPHDQQSRKFFKNFRTAVKAVDNKYIG